MTLSIFFKKNWSCWRDQMNTLQLESIKAYARLEKDANVRFSLRIKERKDHEKLVAKHVSNQLESSTLVKTIVQICHNLENIRVQILVLQLFLEIRSVDLVMKMKNVAFDVDLDAFAHFRVIVDFDENLIQLTLEIFEMFEQTFILDDKIDTVDLIANRIRDDEVRAFDLLLKSD